MPSIEAVAAVVGLIFAAPGAIRGYSSWIKVYQEKLDDRRKQKSLRENPEEPQNYYIKKTHIKYILREDHAEMTKVRIVRALENVDAIAADQYPGIFDEEPWKERPARVNPDFFSIPGVALKRGKYFLISLARDQVFKAGEDHSYMLSY